MKTQLIVFPLFALSLVACGNNGAGPLGIGALVGDRTLSAAEPLFGDAADKCFDSPSYLLGLFDDRGEARTTATPPPANKKVRESWRAGACERLLAEMRLGIRRHPVVTAAAAGPEGVSGTAAPEANLKTSDMPSSPSDVQYTVLERNEIIDALVGTSNRKCGRYTAFLKSYDGGSNSALSVASIVTGGLGGFVGGATTAKTLAGTSSILSGSRAALNEIHFTNQTIQVLASAYEKARREQRRELTNRQACSIEKYSLLRGIEDAMTYHSNCSIITGLAEAARDVQRAESPGLDTMKRTLAEMTAFSRQIDSFDKHDVRPGVVEVSAPTATFDSLFAARDAVTAATLDAAKKATDSAKAISDHSEAVELARVAGEKVTEITAKVAAGSATAGEQTALQDEKKNADDKVKNLADTAKAATDLAAKADATLEAAKKTFADQQAVLFKKSAENQGQTEARKNADLSQTSVCPF